MIPKNNWIPGYKRPRRAATKEGETIFGYIIRLFDEGNLSYKDGDVYVHYNFARRDGMREAPKKVIKLDHKGYYRLNISINGGRYFIPIHRIVYAHHNRIDEFPKGLVINHINGVKTDNRIENLELVTYKENSMHAVRIGLINLENCGIAKLNWDKVHAIRDLLVEKSLSHKKIAEKFGVSKSAIDRIAQNSAWRDDVWYEKHGKKRNKKTGT